MDLIIVADSRGGANPKGVTTSHSTAVMADGVGENTCIPLLSMLLYHQVKASNGWFERDLRYRSKDVHVRDWC